LARSKIRIKGVEARFYDLLINFATGFRYGALLRDAASKMDIKDGEKIIDLGGATGRATKLFAQAAGDTGEVILVDISEIMLKKARKRLKKYKNSKIIKADILKPLNLKGFDKLFISFVLHGLEISERSVLIKNCLSCLKKGGKLYILDYNQFDIDKLDPIPRYLFRHLECELASEFVRWNIERFLRGYKFGKITKWYWKNDKIRLIKAEKL